MCTGGKSSSSLGMEGSMAKDTSPSSSHPQVDNQPDLAGPLMDLRNRPKNFMDKVLCEKNSEHLPILAEYFGVALAFAALGALIRGNKLTTEMKFSPKLQRLGLQVMLKSAMDRLQVLALNAQDLEQRVKENKEATCRDLEAWEAERRTLLQKLSVAEAQIARVERSRIEDAKANEKVVGIFASYEQGWKSEKKKLKREIEILRNEIVGLRTRNQQKGGDGDRVCEDCKMKERDLEKLEDKLCEKEFLIIATMEEARSDQHERNQLAGKLAMLEMLIAELKEKLSKETAKFFELLEVVADVKGKHEETEKKLVSTMSDLENVKRELESTAAAKKNQNTIIEELLNDLANLQKDVDEKEEVIAVMLKRASVDREEKEELTKQLVQSKSKRKSTEAEKDRWKRLAEERARMMPSGRDLHKARRSIGSKVELDKLSEIHRTHNEEVQGLRNMYSVKLESLEGQLKSYEEKIALLESRILVHSAQGQKRTLKEERIAEATKVKEILNGHELVTLLESIVPDVEMVQSDSVVSEIQEVPMNTMALKDWLKNWLDAVKAQHAQHLEQRHWRELDAFQRQMRVKDERMESFRWQLVNMESDFSKMKSELEMLISRLAVVMDEKCRAERALEEKDTELRALLKSMLECSEELEGLHTVPGKLSHHEAQQRVVALLQKELKDAKDRSREIEHELHSSLLKVAEDAEAELRQKDHQLAVVEAKLCQLRIQIDNEKRMSQKVAPDVSLQEMQVVPNKSFTITVVGLQETDIKNAISTACSEVEKLADKVAEVRKQMMESDDTRDSGLEELIDQAAVVSHSGKKLSMLNEALSLGETQDTLFKNRETTTLHLEAVSQALQSFSIEHLESLVEQETLDLSHPHTDEASTSGANSGADSGAYEGEGTVENSIWKDSEVEVNSTPKEGITISEELEFGVNPMPKKENTMSKDFEVETISMSREDTTISKGSGAEVNSMPKGEQNRENMTLAQIEIKHEDMTVDEDAADTRTTDTTSTSRKKGRRKTLKEYFIDSPPELALENAYKSSTVNLTSQKESMKGSGQGILQAIEKNLLNEMTPVQEIGATQTVKPSQSVTPLFQRLKSKRRESNKTREDIQVLGLALEVRKIEERLGQIDKRCGKADVVVNPTTGLPMPKVSPPKKQNKRYAALTGKVGQLAKQMGLTSERSPEMGTDNPLFNRKPITSELLSLQHRAEVVNESLSSIQVQATEDSVDESTVQQTGYSKDRLIDTVRAHLAQVQRSLSSRMKPMDAEQEAPLQKATDPP